MTAFRCAIAQHGCERAVVAEVTAVLNSIAGMKCRTIAVHEAAVAAADLVVICWGAADVHALALLVAQCRGRDAQRSVIVLGAFDDERPLGALLKLGVADFVRLPLSAVELRARVERTLGVFASVLESPVAGWLGCEEPLLCSVSPRFNAQVARLPSLAGQADDVLISGERGTGRRAFVRQIVRLAGAVTPIEIDASKTAAADVENQLGALVAEPAGAHAGASEAMLVVHDLELLSEPAQLLLLQLLKSRSGLGTPGRVRVLATFAEDAGAASDPSAPLARLLEHLSAVRVRMPPLRERREDLLPLVRLFLARRCDELGRAVPALSPAAARYLVTHEWRGNASELCNALSQALHSTPSDVLGLQDLLAGQSQQDGMIETSLQETKTQLIVSFERTFLEQLMQACHGNITKAARVTQKNRRALFELIRKHEIDVERYRTGPATPASQ
jgi:two-component system, NtrC family, response regulator GlrR